MSLRGERLLTHNLIVGGGTIAAGLVGIAFQSLAAAAPAAVGLQLLTQVQVNR